MAVVSVTGMLLVITTSTTDDPILPKDWFEWKRGDPVCV